MILIFSERTDASTNDIVEWLKASKTNYKRINGSEERHKLKYIDLDSEKIIFEDNGIEIDLMNAKCVWYRRSGMQKTILQSDPAEIKNTQFFLGIAPDNYVYNILTNELSALTEYIHEALESNAVFALSKRKNNKLNKMKVLALAMTIGLKTPPTHVISKRNDLLGMVREGSIITKAITDGIYRFIGGYGYYTYTEKIDEENIKKLPTVFFPSIVQKEIKKKYEIRIFYLCGLFFPMVLFTQQNEETQVDSRKNAANVPGRQVPYKLPNEVEHKLTKLMDMLGLNTGSIDMIYTTGNEYVFLEVNPVGQFGYVSEMCNYQIEREIAKILNRNSVANYEI